MGIIIPDTLEAMIVLFVFCEDQFMYYCCICIRKAGYSHGKTTEVLYGGYSDKVK